MREVGLAVGMKKRDIQKEADKAREEDRCHLQLQAEDELHQRSDARRDREDRLRFLAAV